MRSLIRPTLFLVARLGLFLAVVAWVLSHWWWCSELTTPVASVSLFKEGWAAMREDGQTTDWDFALRQTDLLGHTAFWFKDPLDDEDFSGLSHGASGFCFGGLTIARYPIGNLSILGIRHYLIVTIFTLFNGVLMSVYRKRGEATPEQGGLH